MSLPFGINPPIVWTSPLAFVLQRGTYHFLSLTHCIHRYLLAWRTLNMFWKFSVSFFALMVSGVMIPFRWLRNFYPCKLEMSSCTWEIWDPSWALDLTSESLFYMPPWQTFSLTLHVRKNSGSTFLLDIPRLLASAFSHFNVQVSKIISPILSPFSILNRKCQNFVIWFSVHRLSSYSAFFLVF